MPTLNFKKQFSELVSSGKKRQTIRSIRKIPIKVGDKLYLYSGLRQKHPLNLLKKYQSDNTFDRFINPEIFELNIINEGKWAHTICQEINDFEILGSNEVGSIPFGKTAVKIDGKFLSLSELDDLASADGFDNLFLFLNFFKETHGLPFKGQLIKW
jgi:hypothetical protein